MKVKNLKIFIPFSRFNRVTSMALIHEELYESKGVDMIDFAAHLQKLTSKTDFRSFQFIRSKE